VSASEQPEFDSGTAGVSARREYERRRANREQRVRVKHPHIGELMLALADAPTHETAWARGARGEERVAELLAKHLNPSVLVLHDRSIPRTRGNIDHIAVARSGVWVIDAKRYKGKVAVTRPLVGQARLTIAGRDKSRLLDGLAYQVDLVELVIAEVAPGVPVQGALCFVEADLPILGTLAFHGYPLLYAKPLAKRINAVGSVASDQIRHVAAALAQRFPPA
jgi:hypothetical protein